MYATYITKCPAVESSFEIASSDSGQFEEAGLLLRRHIKKAHEDYPALPWPPTAAFLRNDAIHPSAFAGIFDSPGDW